MERSGGSSPKREELRVTMRLRSFGAACGAMTLVIASSALCAFASASLFGRNLIVNGGAEAWSHAGGASFGVPLGWTTTGTFTVVAYGAPGGYPNDTSPGAPNRGKMFFSGGHAPVSTASQTIDLSAAAEQIDAAHVHFTLTGWLGGYRGQSDNMRVTVRFNGDGKRFGQVELAPVLARDRRGVTGTWRRTASGTVPRETRSAEIVITSSRVDGLANDGYADEISLVLTQSG